MNMSTFYKYKPMGFVQVTGLSSAKGIAPPPGARMAIITCITQSISWRDDGTAPTAGAGIILPVNTPFQYSGDLGAFQAIETAASATLNISFYG